MALPTITYRDDFPGWQARNEFELESMCKQILNRYVGSVAQHRVVESIRYEICSLLERYCEKHNVYFNRKDIEIDSNIPQIADYSGTIRHAYTPEVKVRLAPSLIKELQNSVQWIRFREEFQERALNQAKELISFHGHKISWLSSKNFVDRNDVLRSVLKGQCDYCHCDFLVHRPYWHEFILKIDDHNNTVFNIHNIEMPALKEKQAEIICEKFVAMI